MSRMCESCTNTETVGAVISGVYHAAICKSCLSRLSTVTYSSGVQGFDRRRQYEDHAQDTIQPYNAAGPNLEFLRLYPEAAAKVFTAAEIERLKRQL